MTATIITTLQVLGFALAGASLGIVALQVREEARRRAAFARNAGGASARENGPAGRHGPAFYGLPHVLIGCTLLYLSPLVIAAVDEAFTGRDVALRPPPWLALAVVACAAFVVTIAASRMRRRRS